MGDYTSTTLNFRCIDDLIKHLGNPGRFQTLTFIMLVLNYFPVVFHHVSMAFYGYSPPHECRPRPGADPSDVIWRDASSGLTPANVTVKEKIVYHSCDAVLTSPNGVNRTEQCRPGEYEYGLPATEQTVVMEWDLVCDRASLVHLTTTVYYLGVMLGGFACGYFSDRFGRRPVILTTLTLVTVLGTGLAFVRQFSVFTGLRFVLGFLVQGIHTPSYVMAVELFPMQSRTMAGCLIQVGWGAAVLALGGVAWLLKDWRWIQLAISLPSVLVVIYFWCLPESLRWLLAKGRRKPAEHLIKRMVICNRTDSPLRHHPQLATQALLGDHQDVAITSNEDNTASSDTANVDSSTTRGVGGCKDNSQQGSIRELFSSPVMLKLSVVLFYIWFCSNISYFGLLFMSTSLAGNRFVNFSITAGVEFFTYVINIFVIQRFGRRNPLCIYFSVAAISCLGIGVTPHTTSSGTDLTPLITAFSVAGRYAAGGTFTAVELLTVEIYPTVFRNVGTGLCSFWGRLGAMLAPQCLNLGLYTFHQFPAILIGGMTLLGAALTRVLPDTSHALLPDTVNEIVVGGEGQKGVSDDNVMGVLHVSMPLLPTERVTSV